MKVELNVPVLTTERLTLRGPIEADAEAVIAFFADETRSSAFGGPLERQDAWRWWGLLVGHWVIRGYGYWTVTETGGDDTPFGIVGLWNPDGWPEPEIGWVMFEGSEGKGYAYEAAKAVRGYAYDVLGWTTLTSNIVPGADRSEALAKRLGAFLERTYENPHMGPDRLFRHPGPSELEGA
ncbi:MAG: GNAT family N-acetyltransferase [Litoreibacter sp.]|nr:GNAT family N-acetyltransferase [Litoreibacter sp.]